MRRAAFGPPFSMLSRGSPHHYPAGELGAALPGSEPGPPRGRGSQQLEQGSHMAEQVGIKELLEAGVHFGHQTRRWNPKMRRFIFGERGGIHIIDLQQTEKLLARAQEFVGNVAARGGTVMFVGAKKQARHSIKRAADAARMPDI